MALSYELVGSRTRRHISQHHHSLTSIHTNNLLSTRSQHKTSVGNSLVNVYFRHKLKINLLLLGTSLRLTRLLLDTSLQKLL
ncbi:hypothetical protein Bca4012_063771 [Brassica carinata]